MKRKFGLVSILICFLIGLLMACDTPTNNGIGNGNAQILGTTSIEAISDGVKIKLPKVTGATSLEVTRFNDKYEKDGYVISIYDLSRPLVMDYFVEKDKSYYYTVVYKDNNSKEIYKFTSEEIKAIGGKGELQFTTSPKATYEPSTGKITFETFPKVRPEVEAFVGKEALRYQFYYRYFPDGGYYGKVGCGVNYFVDGNGKISSYIFTHEENVEGKKMVLIDLSGIEINKDSVTYNQYMSHEDLPTMPNNIPFHDNRPSLTLEPTNEGIKINIPKLDDPEIKKITIDRYTESEYIPEVYIYIDDISTNSITDYYVEKGKEYKYKIHYKDIHYDDVITTKENKITATGGKGKIQFSKRPEAKYENGVMKFTQQPEISNVHNGTKIKYYEFMYRYFPEGGYFGRVGGGINYTLLTDGTVQFHDFVNPGYDVEGKDMVLINYSGVTFDYGNSILYSYYMNHEDLPGMPDPIKFHKVNK